MSLVQNNTRSGLLPFVAAEDLTGKEGRLIELRNSSGATVAATPDAIGDYALYILEKGNTAGEAVDVLPLDPVSNMRAVAKGTGNPGAVLVLADPSTAADKGKLRTIPATAGTYFSPGIAEEAFVDGQHVKFRPWPRLVVVP
jgi:hypothetical protein